MTTTLTVTSVDFVTPALKRIWFSADDLWGVPTGHWVHVELWESYLEAAG